MSQNNFLFHYDTKIIVVPQASPAVINAVDILKRDMKEAFFPTEEAGKEQSVSEVALCYDATLLEEAYRIEVCEQKISVFASDELGFVYGLLEMSHRFLGIEPFDFWMNKKPVKMPYCRIPVQSIVSPKYGVRFRGWFFNDEVLLSHWKLEGDSKNSFQRAYETLLRCGGNMVIPGTDLVGQKMRKLASDMGLYITHHHAEPLGAEMFTRVYPDKKPNFTENKELFIKIWEQAIEEQKNQKTIYALGFRGQGDCPFWNSDDSGDFDTDEKRGKLISDLIRLQRKMVEEKVEHPFFCTNLYGEIMELYEKGYVDIDEDVIKIYADNGYGKMVTRRRDNHPGRIVALPKDKADKSGIYYHVSFYDLQAANHITMLPNTVDFVNRELNEVIDCGASWYWLINCSNVLPHVYYLDAVRRKWMGEELSDESQSKQFSNTYFDGNEAVAKLYETHAKIVPAFGPNEDEHAGEQFYTENPRIVAWHFIRTEKSTIEELRWCTGDVPLKEQIKRLEDIAKECVENTNEYVKNCEIVYEMLDDRQKYSFGSTLYLDARIHWYCQKGMVLFAEGVKLYLNEEYRKAFYLLGKAAKQYEMASWVMRECEYGDLQGFFENDCFADIKHTAYMIRKLMGTVREFGDNIRHDSWYRELLYKPEDRQIFTQLVLDNHMTDEELWNEMDRKMSREISI